MRVVWIFDEVYAALTHISVSSFLAQYKAPVTLYFTGRDDAPEIREVFEQLCPELDWIHFCPEQVPGSQGVRDVVLNRLARIDALRRYRDQPILMLDSDTIYSTGLKENLESLLGTLSAIDPGEVYIYGVIEHRRAADAAFFFRNPEDNWNIPLSPARKAEVWAKVFGEPTLRLQQMPQFNNGILLFLNAASVADLWEKFYLRSLKSQDTNPADDQLPLAVAMNDQGIPFRELAPGWNSLGRREGDFFGWHPWAGNWKAEFYPLLHGGTPRSEFGRLVAPFLKQVPEAWQSGLRESLYESPIFHRTIPGEFPYAGIFRDMVELVGEDTRLVKIGRYPGPATCYLAELIRNSGKSIDFDSIFDTREGSRDVNSLEAILTEVGLGASVDFRSGDPVQLAKAYPENSLDFVCMDLDLTSEQLEDELTLWYDKLKPGGIMAGFDQSLHEMIGIGMNAIVLNFCQAQGIGCRCEGQVFRFSKPPVPVMRGEVMA